MLMNTKINLAKDGHQVLNLCLAQIFPPFQHLKIDLSDHPFIKDGIFEYNIKFPPRGTPIGIITQYCDHHNMPYISQSENIIPWNDAFPARNRTNFCILGIGRKEPTTVQQVL